MTFWENLGRIVLDNPFQGPILWVSDETTPQQTSETMQTIESRMAKLSLESLRALSLLDDACMAPIKDLVALEETGVASPIVARSYAIAGYVEDAVDNALEWWDGVTVNRQLW